MQDTALKVFVLLVTALPEHLSITHEMTLSFVFITALFSVPVISSMLLRGQGASGIDQMLGASAAAWTLGRTQALGIGTAPKMGRSAQHAYRAVSQSRASRREDPR